MPAFPPAFAGRFWNRRIPLAPGFASAFTWALRKSKTAAEQHHHKKKNFPFHEKVLDKINAF
jgi:hypothetical protein